MARSRISSRKVRTGYNYGSMFNTANSAFKAARQGYGLYKDITRTKNKKSTSAVGVTRNHDFSVQYRKKSMPRWKRRRWANFSRKVNAVLTSKLATQTQLFNRVITNSNPAGGQNYIGAVIYGKNGQDGSEFAGMSNMRDLVAVSGYVNGQRLLFKSAVLDVTLSVNADAPTSLEVDIYDCVFRGETLQANFRTDMQAAESSAPTIGTNNSLEFTDRGTTLFDFPLFLSNTKCKILKKTKVFLPPGNTTTYQIRDPKNRSIYVDQMTEYGAAGAGGWIMPGWTRGVFAVFKPVAGSGTAVVNLNMGATTKYSYVVIKENRVADGTT